MQSDVASMQELMVGLCAAVGTDLGKIQDEVRASLESAGLRVRVIRASELIGRATRPPPSNDEAARIDHMMKMGNEIRKRLGSGDAVARLVIAEIRSLRQEPDTPDEQTAYILTSLKHPEEYSTLSKLYGDAFAMISVYQPKEERKHRLCKLIASSKGTFDPGKYVEEADGLIRKDQEEPDNYLGQSVRETFPLADAFVSAENSARQIRRTINLMLGHPFISPTRDEHGMFHAFSAARRSADLSRQVGAVVGNDRGDLIAMGCNEVPRVGGGSYWEDEEDTQYDRRDFQIGWDQSAALRKEIISEIVAELRRAKWLPDEYNGKADADIAEEFISTGKGLSFKGKRISSLLEFGRIVHAELAALMDAARRGVPVSGHSLYCTTFPCHMCARHIISSGLKRVYYIEPYPKSLAKELYEREICVDNDNTSLQDAVKFIPFVGIAPKRFMNWFEFEKRKDDRGYAFASRANLSKRKVSVTDVDRSVEENVLLHDFMKKMGEGSWSQARRKTVLRGSTRKLPRPSPKSKKSRSKSGR